MTLAQVIWIVPGALVVIGATALKMEALIAKRWDT